MNTKGKWRNRLCLIILLVGPVFGLLAYWIFEISPPVNAYRCKSFVEKSVGENELRSWALAAIYVDSKSAQDSYHKVGCPQFLQNVWKRGLPSIYVREARGDEKAHVMIAWGSGFMGHWGLLVGAPDFVPVAPGVQVRKWKEGIYFWRDFR